MKFLRAHLGGVLLVFVVEVGRERVMRVVHFGDQVRDRQLQAMHDVAQRFVLRREAELRPEVEQDVRDVRHDQVAILQERRGERDVRLGLAAHQLHHRVGALAVFLRAARDIDVFRARIFQREPDEFATALQAVPVIQFVGHGVSSWIGLLGCSLGAHGTRHRAPAVNTSIDHATQKRKPRTRRGFRNRVLASAEQPLDAHVIASPPPISQTYRIAPVASARGPA